MKLLGWYQKLHRTVFDWLSMDSTIHKTYQFLLHKMLKGLMKMKFKIEEETQLQIKGNFFTQHWLHLPANIHSKYSNLKFDMCYAQHCTLNKHQMNPNISWATMRKQREKKKICKNSPTFHDWVEVVRVFLFNLHSDHAN